jgi:chemotaxis protein methyltransferase CheR
MRDTRPQDTPAVLDVEGFEALRQLVMLHAGMYLSADNLGRIRRIVASRLRALSLDRFASYHRLITRDDAAGAEERACLIDAVTNTETYFFREAQQLEVFAQDVLPELLARRRARRRLALWSAGCSSGEEPYTLAMLLLRHPRWEPELAGWDVRILGTDVNRRVLARAREGRYAASAFKGLEDEERERLQRECFTRADEHLQVTPEVRRLVSFLQLNLVDASGVGLIGEMDAIFCRNVLMYFPQAVRLAAVQGFYRRLAVGGYLFLGHSENLLGVVTPFELRRHRGQLVYRKPLHRPADLPAGDWGP